MTIKTNKNIALSVVLTALVALMQACGASSGPGPDPVQTVERSQIGVDVPVDKTPSCVNKCGALLRTDDGYCGCDDACGDFGDCCADKQQACDGASCDYGDPDKKYVGKSPEICQVMDYFCEDGWGYFQDDCGCGCVKPTEPSCNYDDPDKNYVGKSVGQCIKMAMFACEDGWGYFEDDCGCGCAKQPEPTCNYGAADKAYHGKSADQCAVIKFTCQQGWGYFADDCGCGCEKQPASTVEQISAGTSFGMCAGYCQSELELEPSKATLTQKSWQPSAPDKSVSIVLSAQQWAKLTAAVDTQAISQLPDTIGCPDCNDGGAEWFAVEINGTLKKVTFPFGQDVPSVSTLLSEIRAIRKQLEAQL